MKRAIEGFHQDREGHWVAELSCCHVQHVRHQPPFVVRPWTPSQPGRDSMLGAALECPLCDARELPADVQAYKKTPEFTERSIPPGLLREHSTKAGVWGVINVVQGALLYTLNPPYECQLLVRAGETAVVVPEMLHSVMAQGAVRFYVEFYRRKN